jgi:serine protease Do
MKQFSQLLVAAVLGSVCTISAYQWWGKENGGVRIEHVEGVPTNNVAWSKNENGVVAPLDFAATAEKVTKSVVHIKSTMTQSDSREGNDPMQYFFGPGQNQEQRPSQATGSGVIVNEGGYIVTNNHVVQGADLVDVTLSDNRSYKAEVVGTDPDTDIALIKINEKGLPALAFVNSDNSKVGEWVLAVGNPLNLNSTVTAGIISAKGRNINIIGSNREGQEHGNTAIESFIQTDAAINPGNSGGALVNLDGQLLGINTAIASQTGFYSGYGFAVPANIVSKVVEDLIAYGTVQRGWLGIQVASVNNDLAKENGLDTKEGAFVSGFGDAPELSAAKQAGIQAGDVIVKLDEFSIRSSSSLIEYIGRKRPGNSVSVTIDRKGKTIVIPVTLKNREGNIGAVKREEKSSLFALGIKLEDVDGKLLKKHDLNGGVKVKSIQKGKLAKYTDMREGFIITHIDDAPVKSVTQVNEILKNKKAGDLVTFSGIYEDYPREFIYAIRM